MDKEYQLDDIMKIEWWIYDIDHNDYSLSLNKDSLEKVLAWEELKRTLYLSSHNFSIDDVQEWMRKELIIWLLSDEDRANEMTDALVKWNNKPSEKVSLKIARNLLENLLGFEWGSFSDSYDYRYNMRWDKILFYVLDKWHNRMWLNDSIDFNNQLFDKKFPKWDK